MTSDQKPNASGRRAIIGSENNFWLFDSERGFDLTHPESPDSSPVRPSLTMKTTTSAVTIDPAKSALVIVDMQNYFLRQAGQQSIHDIALTLSCSPAFGRSRGAGHEACDQLVRHAIPGARKAGMRVIWLNWGLTDHDAQRMPPAVTRAFGFEGTMGGKRVSLDKYGDFRYKGGDQQLEDGRAGKKYSGLGGSCGVVPDPSSGQDVDAGGLLVRDQWNSDLYAPLKALWEEGKDLPGRNDVWIHKNRMSGLANEHTDLAQYLEAEGIRTLLFTGVNTEQCVGGTYQDAFSMGYDCILLGDGAGTTSPNFSQQCIEYNAANTWGFSASCKDLADAAEHMNA